MTEFDWGVLLKYHRELLAGLRATVVLTLVGLAGSLVLGIVVGARDGSLRRLWPLWVGGALLFLEDGDQLGVLLLRVLAALPAVGDDDVRDLGAAVRQPRDRSTRAEVRIVRVR